MKDFSEGFGSAGRNGAYRNFSEEMMESKGSITVITPVDNFEAGVYIHPSAEVSPKAQIGAGTKIWHQSQVRERACLGKECILGKGVYVDTDVEIGDFCKIQNGVSLFKGVKLESGVFIGPHVTFTNDRYPRAITPQGNLKSDSDWEVECTVIGYGASIGAGSVILPGIRIGAFAMIGAGSLVTGNVGDHCLHFGHPAKFRGYVCRCGRKLALKRDDVSWYCDHCRENYIFNT